MVTIILGFPVAEVFKYFLDVTDFYYMTFDCTRLLRAILE